MTNNTVKINSFDLPPSDLLSEASHRAIAKERSEQKVYFEALQKAFSSMPENDMPARRALEAKLFYQTDIYAELLKRYPVVIEKQTIGGVPCEVFTPIEGISSLYTDRLLINFHGGGFMGGSQTNSRLESAPLAVLMGIKVISVDYRMAPEYCHPAATDDAEAVYCALLTDYAPEHIGIYGASAGASLSAMLLARLMRNDIQGPAAVGFFGSGAFNWRAGDYGHIGPALVQGLRHVTLGGMEANPYYKGVSLSDAGAFPGIDSDFCRHCCPALLVSASRDYILSAVIHTETQLKKHGVETELHIWEGLEHVFHYNPWLPESEEMHKVVVEYFSKYLGG